MKTLLPEKKVCGLTLVEVLLVIGILVILAAVLLPALLPPKRHRSRISCQNNLRQIAIAFRNWEGDNDGKSPMQVSVTNGGTRELIAAGTVYPHFLVMSNELSTPKLLFCPMETSSARKMATTFLTTIDPAQPAAVPFTGDTNVSYFVGLDTDDMVPQSDLFGDRNITVNGVAVSPGLHSFRTNDFVGWSSEMHKNKGNILLTDGSVDTS